MNKTALLGLFTFVVCLGCNKSDSAPATMDGSGGVAIAPSSTGFAAVAPVFAQHCADCHGAQNPKFGLSLTSYEMVMKGSDKPVIKAGDPDASMIVQALHGANGKKQMPPKGPLPADQIKAIEDWIRDGAKP